MFYHHQGLDCHEKYADERWQDLDNTDMQINEPNTH